MSINHPKTRVHSPRTKNYKTLLHRIVWLSIAMVVVTIVTVSSRSAFADDDEIMQYLRKAEPTAYLQSPGHNLEIVDSPRLRRFTDSVFYQKSIDGIPVHGGLVRVILDEHGQVADVIDDSTADLETKLGQPAFGSKDAEKIVSSGLSKSRAIDASTQLVWFRQGNRARLAWEVTTQLDDTGESVSPTGLITVLDAETGDTLSQSQFDIKNYEVPGPKTVHGVFPRIVINNAIGAAGSRNYAAPFDAVVSLDFGCTGTLIASDVVLSARHCEAQAGDTITFGDNSNNGVYTATVQSSMLPDGNGSLLDGGDVAILKLTAPVPSQVATPMRLIDATDSLQGQTAATIGYGYNGVGSQGHNFTADGWRWGGENVIDRYGSPADASGSNIISTDFDNGTGGANTIAGSSPVPLEYEATTAPGDSGGPVLVQVNGEWAIAGVLSGGTTNTSVYGDISWWTGTAIYRTQIEAAGGEFTDSTPPNNDDGIGEAGRITNLTHQWKTINLMQTYNDPVIVFGPLSNNGDDPSTVRIRNVTSSSFQVQIQEYNYLNGQHVAESVGYVVLEAGTYNIGGSKIVAGNQSVNHDWRNVNFGQSFSSNPVVLSQCISFEGSDAIVTRQRSISSSGFKLRLQEEEGSNYYHLFETVSWIAIEQGAGISNDSLFEAVRTADSVTHNNHTRSFESPFASAPVLLASMQTYDGPDTASIRYRTLSAGQTTFYLDEETSDDSETNHTTEVVGYLALEPGLIFGSGN